MSLADLLFRHCPPNASKIIDVGYRIELLDVLGLDVIQPEFVEPIPGQFRVVADVGEELGAGAFLSDHVTHLAVEEVAEEAVAESAAQKVLLVQGGKHQRGRDISGVVEDVHVRGFQLLVLPGAGAGADGDDQQLIGAGGPVEVVRLRRRHQKGLEGRVVVGGDPTVHEDEAPLADGDDFGGEIDRRGGARPDELPQGELEIAVVLVQVLVVLGEWIVPDRPGGIGGGVSHHHHEKGLQPRAAEVRHAIFAVNDLPELGGQLFVLILVLQPVEEEGLIEHLLPAVQIEIPDLPGLHPQGDAGGDDGAGARSGDEVEVAGEGKLFIPVQLTPEKILQGDQHFDGHHPADPPAVQGQDLLRPLRLDPFHQFRLVDPLNRCHGASFFN